MTGLATPPRPQQQHSVDGRHVDAALAYAKLVEHPTHGNTALARRGDSLRALGIGDVVISSADPSKPHAVLRNVRDPENVHEILRRAMLDARKRYRYSVQEEM